MQNLKNTDTKNITSHQHDLQNKFDIIKNKIIQSKADFEQRPKEYIQGLWQTPEEIIINSAKYFFGEMKYKQRNKTYITKEIRRYIREIRNKFGKCKCIINAVKKIRKEFKEKNKGKQKQFQHQIIIDKLEQKQYDHWCKYMLEQKQKKAFIQTSRRKCKQKRNKDLLTRHRNKSWHMKLNSSMKTQL